ncbi:unnamed protein product [Didymodactylos carnosus]|uniref:Uncharacterized protein n=1 Tax=Didymodactylos carnosus TaxID=1234261 RepID=A0A8S2CX60_9BILA|nr:unnamed protein product [Didymodactylos carnosus]CAF3534460.1 unnamed protein product [Didymodactylos carnosus]
MKTVFTEKSLPSVIIQEDNDFPVSMPCAVYGAYCGREHEENEEKIYVNKEIIECSQYAFERKDVVKYAAIILFTIIHEIGHWSFHHFACNMDHDLATPKGVLMEEAGEAIEFLLFGFRIQHYGPEDPKFMVIGTEFDNNLENHTSLTIPITLLVKATVLDEELMKFTFKRVFNAVDEPTLIAATANSVTDNSRKRVFNPCDKTY